MYEIVLLTIIGMSFASATAIVFAAWFFRWPMYPGPGNYGGPRRKFPWE